MTTRSRRGGNRTGVSGPGPFSERVDVQPVRELPAASTGGHGTRKEFAELQAAAPMPEVSNRPPIPGGEAIFGPTARPNEPQTAGLIAEPELLPEDPDAAVRQIYAVFPDPYLLRLIRGS